MHSTMYRDFRNLVREHHGFEYCQTYGRSAASNLLKTRMKGRALHHQILGFEQTDQNYQNVEDLYPLDSGYSSAL